MLGADVRTPRLVERAKALPGLQPTLAVVAAHVALGPLVRGSSTLATAHALLTVAAAIIWSGAGRHTDRVAFSCAYIAGSEVLWRMSGASVFWEYGKYAVVLLSVIGLAKGRGLNFKRTSRLAAIFFALLLPSISLTITGMGLTESARQLISFNLSGPLALTTCAMLFAAWTPDGNDLERVLFALVIPITAVAAAVLQGLRQADFVAFGSESSFTASGGFGPNQVSAVLGLGALAALLIVFLDRRSWARFMCGCLATWFVIQSVLTFSRGGIFSLVVAFGIFVTHSLSNARLRRTTVLVLVTAAIIGPYLLFPRVDMYTGGAVRGRFTDFRTTGRLDLAKGDFNIWKTSPLVGIGPGMATYERRARGPAVAAHTEITRLLAEHGLLGGVALLLLLVIGVGRYSAAPAGVPRAWVAAMGAWSVAEMLHAAMRLSAISFVFGLALVAWRHDEYWPIRWNRFRRE